MVAQAATYTAEEKTDTKVVADFYAALDARDAAGGESKMPIRPILGKTTFSIWPGKSRDARAWPRCLQGDQAGLPAVARRRMERVVFLRAERLRGALEHRAEPEDLLEGPARSCSSAP
jgi:hypothetical protein